METLKKREFLKSELGELLDDCIFGLDTMLTEKSRYQVGSTEYDNAYEAVERLLAQWEVFRVAIKQFYGIEYNFARNDEYFGVVNNDETDFLIRYDRFKRKDKDAYIEELETELQ